jgi:hypothetical protein
MKKTLITLATTIIFAISVTIITVFAINDARAEESFGKLTNVRANLAYHLDLADGKNVITIGFDKPERLTNVRLFIGKETKDNWVEYKDYTFTKDEGYKQIQISPAELSDANWQMVSSEKRKIYEFEDYDKYYFQLCSVQNGVCENFSKCVDVIPCPMWGKQ